VADYNVKGKVSLDVGSFIADARRASESLNNLDTSVNKTSSSMKYLKRGALAAATGLGALAVAGVKAASDYQQSMIAFTKMMGSAEKATTFVKELQAFAASTPFELPQVQAGAKKLMAFGFEASQVLPMLTAIGNAASGLSLGSEGIDRLTLAIGQMQE
jgi:D-arabinose 1-dehydrogenase-like Zn-dependent alcohol dehydrogenase